MNARFSGLQQLGRALMLPVAVLPIAGLLLRLGQPDVLDWPTMAAAGDAVFSNLGLGDLGGHAWNGLNKFHYT